MNKKKKDDGVKMVLPGWMASYADMFTVLMAFFVLLFAMSTIEEELFQRFVMSFNPARAQDFMVLPGAAGILADEGAALLPYVVPPEEAGAPGDEGGYGDVPDDFLGGNEPMGNVVSDMYNTFMTYMADQLGADWAGGFDPVTVTEGEYYFSITFEADGMLFNSGQAILLPAAREILAIIGPALQTFSAEGHGIIVEGHTDNIPINTLQFPSNTHLAGSRAAAVTDFLIYNSGVDARMIFPLALADRFPVADNNTLEGRAQNRRVEIMVFTTDATEVGPVASWFRIPGTE